MSLIRSTLLTSVIGGAIVFTSTKSSAWEYELKGRIYEERLNGRSQVAKSGSRIFSVCVKDCSWLIRTEPDEVGKLAGVRETGSANGHEIFDLLTPAVPLMVQLKDGDAKSGRRPSSQPPGQGTVVSNAVPASCDDGDLFTPHLWLMFASSCFFQGRTNTEITPVYDINACVLHEPDLTMETRWELLKQPPALPAFLAYMNTRGYLTRDNTGRRAYLPVPYPHNQGFTNAIYAITGETNWNGLTLPTGFTFQRFQPANAGKRKEDLRVVARGFAVITNVSFECSRKGLLPLAKGSLVMDRRLKTAQPPIAAVPYLARKDRWLTLEEVKAIHASELRRAGKKPFPSAVYLLFMMALVGIPALFHLKSRSQKRAPDLRPKP